MSNPEPCQCLQARVKQLLPAQALLVGHALDNDLAALKLHHRRLLDTSVLFQHPKVCLGNLVAGSICDSSAQTHVSTAAICCITQAPWLCQAQSLHLCIGEHMDPAAVQSLHPCAGEITDPAAVQGQSYKPKLKYLVSEYLKRAIQTGEHDSVEDARAAMELAQLKIR